MAATRYYPPSLLPWQARRATRNYSRRYRLDLWDHNRKVIATLALMQCRDDLWTWYIDFTLPHIVGAVEGGLHVLPDVAEAEALRELARWLHPETPKF